MRKTTHINLNGQIFCIDEDAYASLQTYIETLEKYYLSEEDGKEIMEDIESRIAELLDDALQHTHKKVISQTEVEQVIETMGQPALIIEGSREGTETSTAMPKRKLYRDTEYAMLGGVASGLALYLDISRIWVRLAFLLLIFAYGTTAWVYIILWIIIPKAVNSKQKMEMRGERINVSNIEKNIRNAYRDVTHNSKLKNIVEKVEKGLKAFGNVLLRLLAVAGFAAGIFFLFVVIWRIIVWNFYTPEEVQLLSDYIFGPVGSLGIKALVLGATCIPFGILTYLSASYLFKFRKKRAAVLLISGSLWLTCCLICLGVSAHYFFRYLHRYEITREVPIELPREKQEITVKFRPLIADGNMPNEHMLVSRVDDYILANFKAPDQNSKRLYIRPDIHFRKSEKSTPEIIIRKSVRGFSDTEGGKHLNNICYHYECSRDTLLLDNFFTLAEPKWQWNAVDITILLPENYRVNLMNTPLYWHPRRQDGLYGMQNNRLTPMEAL